MSTRANNALWLSCPQRSIVQKLLAYYCIMMCRLLQQFAWNLESIITLYPFTEKKNLVEAKYNSNKNRRYFEKDILMSNTNFNFLLCFLWIFRETSNYHRCGRTDKGVSAFSQVKYYIKNSSYTDTKTFSQVKYYIKIVLLQI